MDQSVSDRFVDTFDIYRRYCDIRSGNVCSCGEEGYNESQMRKSSRVELAELLKFVESRFCAGNSIFAELYKLMTQPKFMIDSSEFSRFYNFVFFMCRENGQKNITVSRAVTAWRLVLAGRFCLLSQWCEFVENNQRHNISEDTWQQVLAFSRCVNEKLEGYDSEGAWPVLLDDFVEHLSSRNFFCHCHDSESQPWVSDNSLPISNFFPGSKRKLAEDLQEDEADSIGSLLPCSMEQSPVPSLKRSRHKSPVDCPKSPCAVEGCLSKGFERLFSTLSYSSIQCNCSIMERRLRRVSFI